MIDLYGMTSPNVTKITIMLEETGLEHRFHWVKVFREEQFSPEFLRMNPNHKVPVLVDHAGPQGQVLTLFESGAILIYLAEKTGMLLAPEGTSTRYETLKWLMIQLTGFGPMCGQHVHFSRFAPEGNDYSRERYFNETHRLYRVLDKRLAESECLGGTEYSIADIAMFPWAALHDSQDLSWDAVPHVSNWYERLAKRPAIQRAMTNLEDVMKKDAETFETASKQNLDRFLGRHLPVS